MNTKLQSVGVGIVMACAVFVVFFTQAPAGTWFNLRNAPGNYLQKLIAPGSRRIFSAVKNWTATPPIS